MFRVTRLKVFGAGAAGAGSVSYGFTWFFQEKNTHDIPPSDSKYLPKKPEDETGVDRVRKIFILNEYGAPSDELISISQTAMCGLAVGVFYGGYIYSRSGFYNYFEQNQAEIYESVKEAREKIAFNVTRSFAKGAIRWGWRLGLFTGVYMLTATCVSAYRDKDSVIDYSIGGMVAGGLYKLSHGIRGTIVGSGLGLALGTVAGCFNSLIMFATGVSWNDVRKAQSDFYHRRERAIHELDAKAMGEELLRDERNELLMLRESKEKLQEKEKQQPGDKKAS